MSNRPANDVPAIRSRPVRDNQMQSNPAPKERVEVVVAIVRRGGRVLICQRLETVHLAGYWEFPGGKREPGETVEQCLHRELAEELAIATTPVRPLDPIDHDYPTIRVRLIPILCDHLSGEPQPLASQQTRWVLPADLRAYRFPPSNADLIEKTIALLAPTETD